MSEHVNSTHGKRMRVESWTEEDTNTWVRIGQTAKRAKHAQKDLIDCYHSLGALLKEQPLFCKLMDLDLERDEDKEDDESV